MWYLYLISSPIGLFMSVSPQACEYCITLWGLRCHYLIEIFQLQYNLMAPPSYMQAVIYQNILCGTWLYSVQPLYWIFQFSFCCLQLPDFCCLFIFYISAEISHCSCIIFSILMNIAFFIGLKITSVTKLFFSFSFS